MKIKFIAVASSLAFAFLFGVNGAHASTATITFDTSNANFGPYTGSTTEDGFVYAYRSGSLFVNVAGSPGKDMEGDALRSGANGGGGVLDVRTDGIQSTFTFNKVDVDPIRPGSSDVYSGTQTLKIYGLLNSQLVGTEEYTLSNFRSNAWVTQSADMLAGKNIDELQFLLNGVYSPNVLEWLGIDNIVLGDAITPTPPASPVPEPSSLAMFGTAILGLAGAARRKFSQA